MFNWWDYIKSLTSESEWLLNFAAILALALLLFKKTRGGVIALAKWVYVFFTFPAKGQKIVCDFVKVSVDLEEIKSGLLDLKRIIGYNGGSGLLDKVGFIAGIQNNKFWMESQPGVICDGSANVISATHGYCRVLGLSSQEDLMGLRWKNYVYQEAADKLEDDFVETAARGEIFRRMVGHRNSKMQDIGIWVVVANPISAPEAITPRYLSYIYPYDERAVKVAESFGIVTTPPI